MIDRDKHRQLLSLWREAMRQWAATPTDAPAKIARFEEMDRLRREYVDAVRPGDTLDPPRPKRTQQRPQGS